MFAEEEEDFEIEEYVQPPFEKLLFTVTPALEKVHCNTLVVAFYGISSLYASSLIDIGKPIGRVNFQKAKQRSLASVYSTQDKSFAFIIFNEELQKMKQIHFSEFINQQFEFKNLYIFTSIPKGVLQKDDGVNLKYLQSSWGLDLKGPKFNQGLGGPEADLLQNSQINKINAVCFIGIYSDYQLKKETVFDIFDKVSTFLPIESKYDIGKQIKAYNMKKYSNKLYL